MSEFLFLSIVFLFGWTMLHVLGLRGWGAVPAGFIAGSFALVAIGLVFVAARLPTEPVWLMGVMMLFSLAYLLPRRARIMPRDISALVAGLAILAVLVLALREANLVKYHIDSFRYLMSAQLLAEGQYSLANMNLLTKRMLAAPLLHAPAALYGEYYVRAFIPVLAVSLLGTMVWFLGRGVRSRRPQYVAASIAMVLLLATSNRFIWNAFYINAHLYFAIAFLAISASAWLLATREDVERRPLYALIALALPAIVVARPEGFLAAGLAIAPLLFSGTVSWRGRGLVLSVYGVSLILWYGYVALAHLASERSIPLSTSGPLILGAAAVLLVPCLAWPYLTRWRKLLLAGVEIGLWLALAACAVRDPEVLSRSLDAIYQNLVVGAGSWGSSLLVLGGLLILAWSFCRDESLSYLRFPVTAMVPMFLLLAYLREGAYRAGNGDSLNRMLIEIVPLAVLFLAAAAASAQWGLPRRRRGAAGQGPGPRAGLQAVSDIRNP